MPTVIAIQISEKKGVPGHIVPEGLCMENGGLEGDSHAGSGNRQISLFGIESIRKMEMLGMEGLCTRRFAENITTEGISLYELPVGSRFTIGCCEFEVTQIGKSCYQNCAVFQQGADCIMPREGIFACVIKGGLIRPGDTISRLP